MVNGQDGVDGNSAANCNEDNDDDNDVPVEVGGTVQNPGGEPGALAVTGVTSQVYVLSGLIVAVLGLWFMVAAAWFRPQGHRA